MPQVPYKGYPEGGPERVPLRPDIPEAGLMAGVRAMESFGRDIKGVGEEIWHRAVQYQEERNQTEADELNVKYMTEAGRLHADYGAKQGAERVAAFPQYKNDLIATRDNIAKTASNERVHRLFLGKSSGTLGHSIFNGAGQAATAERQYKINTGEAEMALTRKTVADNPEDQGLATLREKEVTEQAKRTSRLKGNEPGSPVEELEVKTEISKLNRGRVEELVRLKPEEGAKLFDEVKDKMLTDDRKQVDVLVRNEVRQHGGRQLAQNVWIEGYGTPTKPQMPLDDMEKKVAEEAEKLRPGDQILKDHAVSWLRSKWDANLRATTRERRDNEQILYKAIHDGMDSQQIMSDPVTSQAYRDLPENHPFKKKPLDVRVRDWKTQAESEKMDANYERLKGLSLSSPFQFLDTNLLEEKRDLKDDQYKDLVKRRDILVKNPTEDPRVRYYMNILRDNRATEMQALKVYRRDVTNTTDRDRYDRFTGGLSSSLDAWRQNKGKLPSDEEFLKQMAPILLRQESRGLVYGLTGFWPTKVPPTEVDTSSKDYIRFRQQYIADQVKQGRTSAPPDPEVVREYQKIQWGRIFGPKESR